MLIVPAIDLKEGVCVRLAQGRFDDVTTYGDPSAQLAAFARAGASWVHIVDLDGAQARQPVQHDLLRKLARETDLQIQCGGGVRERWHVQALLEAGVARVVIGSAALKRTDDVLAWIADFGADRICCAFDARPVGAGFEVVVEGWTADGGRSLEDALSLYPSGSLRHALVTDVSRDGVLTGPNLTLIKALVDARPDLQFQASGGVAAIGDFAALRNAGAGAVIVGRALYERRFTLEDALAS